MLVTLIGFILMAMNCALFHALAVALMDQYELTMENMTIAN